MTYGGTRKGIAYEFRERNTAFSLAFIGIFTATFLFLLTINVVPDPTAHWQSEHGGTPIAAAAANVQNTGTNPAAASSSAVAMGELPVRIVIDAINLDATIGDPSSTNDAVLNQFLKSGAVRYPTSSTLGVDGTVVLFGHSSYLPVIANQAYKTFDGIQNLHQGDEISVYSSDREYRYQVTSVTKVHASDGTVALKADGQYMTLVTCDSFDKATQDRWIVESTFVGAYSLASR